jgi:nitroreductase
MNETIRLLQRHRSIRRFTAQPLAPGVLEELLHAGQGAATSSFIQAVTVIRVNDPPRRRQLALLAGDQAQIHQAAEFLVFCADLHRSSQCCAMHGATAVEGLTEQFIVATVDTALFAQNVAVAAESLGLGICYIGALRNDPAAVAELLEMPCGVYPVFGLCLGYPDQDPEVKPRLPLEVVLKEERYDEHGDLAAIRAYDEHIRHYYATRSGGTKASGWSEQMAGLLSRERRPHMREFLRRQGFPMR